MTVSRRILIHVAIGAALVIAVVAGVTYFLVYEQAEQRAVDQLNTYVSERTQLEEARFETVYNNQEIVKGLILQRDERPVPGDVQQQWDALFIHDPDGAWRSRKEVCDPLHNSSLWLHKDFALTPQKMWYVLNAFHVTNELMPMWEKSYPSVFVMFPENACTGFNPMQPSWVWDTPADYPLIEQEWYYAADEKHNPSRGYVWTGVVPDPISGIPYFTLLVPLIRNGEHICTLGHDVHMERLFSEITNSHFPGATHTIFRSDGRIIANAKLREAILKSEGLLKVQDAGDAGLAALYHRVRAEGKALTSGFLEENASYFSASRMRLLGAEWYFVTLMPRSIVQAQAVHSAKWVWVSGLASLALLLGAFGTILQRQVSRPLVELTKATKAMSAGVPEVPGTVHRGDELGALAESFREMVEKVVAREGDLRELNLDLERRVIARTEDLHRALSRERELNEMKGQFVSLVTHEFRTPLGVIMSAVEVLQRYFDRLTPEKRAHNFAAIFRSTKNLSALIDEVLLLGRVEEGRLEFAPEPLDLEMLCHTITDELCSATGGACPIRFAAENSLAGAASDERVLRHILPNLLSNAVKYSEPGTPVEFRARREGAAVIFEVEDRGIGIPQEDQARLFTSFSRARNVGERPGTGLGLVVVKRCVELHGGTLKLESQPGVGTKVMVSLPVFAASASVLIATTESLPLVG